MKKKTLAILYYENNFEQCYKLSKKFSKRYKLVFISTSFFDSLTNLDLPHKKLTKLKQRSYSFFDEMHYFHKNIDNNIKIDFKYIKRFEKKYLNQITIDQVINFDYFLNEKNNPREDVKFHKDKSKKILLVSLLLKKIERIIKTENIDIFFTMFNANFINNCIYYMSKKTKTKFVNTLLNRDCSISLSENFGLDFPSFIKKQNSISIPKSNLISFKKQYDEILLKSNKNLSNLKTFFFGIVNEIKRIFLHIVDSKRFFLNSLDYKKFINKFGYGTEYYYQKKQFNLFFIHLRYILRSLFLHFYIFFKGKNSEEIFKRKYIYVPLHYYPEAYIYNQIKFDELNMVNKILKNTPKEFCIVIKPHPIFFTYGYEQHKINYYEKLLKNKRVIITSPYTCSISLIKNAKTTITYTGTALLQSALLNKPSFRFGNSELNIFNGIYSFFKKKINKKILEKKINNNFNYNLLYLLNKNSVNENEIYTDKGRNKLVNLFFKL